MVAQHMFRCRCCPYCFLALIGRMSRKRERKRKFKKRKRKKKKERKLIFFFFPLLPISLKVPARSPGFSWGKRCFPWAADLCLQAREAGCVPVLRAAVSQLHLAHTGDLLLLFPSVLSRLVSSRSAGIEKVKREWRFCAIYPRRQCL